MINTEYLFANDNKRLYVNVSIGCNYGCRYCYLSNIDMCNNKIIRTAIDYKEILKEIENNRYPLTSKTLITIGCFCECWDSKNKKITKQLIKYFLKNGNQVQIATKKYIDDRDLEELDKYVQYYGQFVIFVSCPIINNWKQFEPRTDNPYKRIKIFGSKVDNIKKVLFIKPVIEGTTILDIMEYKRLINHYHIEDVVIGSLYTKEGTGEKIDFADLHANESNDISQMMNCLSEYVNVYRGSTEVMKKYCKFL